MPDQSLLDGMIVAWLEEHEHLHCGGDIRRHAQKLERFMSIEYGRRVHEVLSNNIEKEKKQRSWCKKLKSKSAIVIRPVLLHFHALGKPCHGLSHVWSTSPFLRRFRFVAAHRALHNLTVWKHTNNIEDASLAYKSLVSAEIDVDLIICTEFLGAANRSESDHIITHKRCSTNGIESRALIGSCDSGIGSILDESLIKCTIGNETTQSLGGKGDTSSGKTSGECALLSNTRSWKINGNDESGALSFSSDGTTMGESVPSSTAGIAILLNTLSCKGDTAGNRDLCSVEHPDEYSPNNEKNSVCGNGGFMSFRVSSENGNRCFASNTTSPSPRWVENHRWWIIAVIIFIPVIMYFG